MKFLLKTKPLQSLFEFVPVIEQALPEEGEGVKERTLFLAPLVAESESNLLPALGEASLPFPLRLALFVMRKPIVGGLGSHSLMEGGGEGYIEAWDSHGMASSVQSLSSKPPEMSGSEVQSWNS